MMRGRKAGKVGPNIGSRPWKLLRMAPGERLLFEAQPGRASALMQQIGADIHRNGLSGKRHQSIAFAIVPATREVIELVVVLAPT